MANILTMADVPPVVRFEVISETFTESEKIFTTPGAISRSVKENTGSRQITISALSSVTLPGGQDLEYRFVVLKGDASITESTDVGKAMVKFTLGSETGRVDVGVFARKRTSGAYWSVPGMISLYIHQ